MGVSVHILSSSSVIINKYLVNKEIRSKRIKIAREDGLSGEMSLDVALEEVNELDLVEMSVQNGISICKIMDYRKFIYDQKKKEKQVKI